MKLSKTLLLISTLALTLLFGACSSTPPTDLNIGDDADTDFAFPPESHRFHPDDLLTDTPLSTQSSILRNSIVSLANAEVGIIETPIGSNKNQSDGYMHGKNGERYGAIATAPWCSMFASWIYKKAGVPNFSTNYAAVYDFYHWGKAAGRFKTSGPQVGDTVIWLESTTTRSNGHIGIVVGVTSSGITTVEGNSSDQVKKNTYSFPIPGGSRGAFRGYVSADGSSTTPPPPSPTCTRTWPTVQRSTAYNSNAKAVQYLLKARGYSLTVDGYFGAGTESAVKSFQSSKGLTADGVIGKNTWEALVVTVQSGSSGDAVRAVQSKLGITVDGVFGSGTKTAVINFQKFKGLTADGVVGANTWAALVGGKGCP